MTCCKKIQSDIPLKLHLGCYNKRIHGWINVDSRQDANPDVVDDAGVLGKFEENTVIEIYASHLAEHIFRNDVNKVFKRWNSLLTKGGRLRLAVPDMQKVCEHYVFHKDLRLLRSFIWGSQRHPFDYHYIGWDFDTLKEDLFDAGFSFVQKYDAFKTEFAYLDDYAKSYLPHMDFHNGTLMSLNVEARK